MVQQKVMVVMNVSLVFISFLLVLSLLDVELPTLGKAQFALDGNEPICVGNYADQFVEFENLDICCFEARKKLSCFNENNFVFGEDLEKVCRTGVGDTAVFMNNKAHLYCTQQSFWGK